MNDVISADCHLDFWYLPGDLFVSEASAALKDVMPRVATVEGGDAWVYKGNVLRFLGSAGVANDASAAKDAVRTIRTRRKDRTGLYQDALEGHFRPGDPKLRLADQDLDGVSAEVIYGILGLTRRVADGAIMAEIFRIYNDFVYQFRKDEPDRFAPLACLPFNNPEAAAQELRRAADLGFTGAELLASDSVKPVWDRDWDPVWRAADDTGLPISFHNQGGVQVREVPADDPRKEQNTIIRNAVLHAVGRLGSSQFMASIIYSGAFDRYPGFRFVLGESSIGWIPYLLQRMDYEYAEESSFYMSLRLRPSDYFHSNGFVTFERDAIGVQLVEKIGEDNVMWGSDYPHPDGTWPESQKILDSDFRDIPERIRRKVVHDNAAKLYGLK